MAYLTKYNGLSIFNVNQDKLRTVRNFNLLSQRNVEDYRCLSQLTSFSLYRDEDKCKEVRDY